MDLIHEFMMHMLGVPLSRAYFPSVLAVMLERIRKVLNVHSDFEEMPVAAQRNHLRKICGFGLALYVARAETLSGMQQIKEGLGEVDEELWNLQYGTLFDTADKFSRVSMADSPFLPPDIRRSYCDLISKTRIIAANPKMFQLNLLLALTQPTSEDSSLASLHFKYKIILKRRVRWRADWIGLSSEKYDPDLLIHEILSSHENLKKLAKINEKIINS